MKRNTQTLYAAVISLRTAADGTSEDYRLMADPMTQILGRSWRLQSNRAIAAQ